MLSYELAKKVLFKMDPEFAHDSTLQLAEKFPWLLSTLIPSNVCEHPVKMNNLNWRFPVGLAAGLDKNAVALDYWDQLGFGSVEVGTITLEPQAGNPPQRIFRYIGEQSLRNSLGFPSHGLAQVKPRLEKFREKKRSLNVGINIGKNKNSDFEQSLIEYKNLYDSLAPLADYMVINLSSPNTPGLREFQQTESVKNILEFMQPSLQKYQSPLYIKLSPDEDVKTYEKLFSLAENKIAGFITTNTTIAHQWDKGGLSGKPLLEKNKDLYFQFMKWADQTKLNLILCGGFMKAEDILPYWEKGQRFFQVYTGFVYNGPGLLSEVQSTLFNRH